MKPQGSNLNDPGSKYSPGPILYNLVLIKMGATDPFSKKRRSPLDPVSRRTLIVLCLTISLLLVSFGGGSASFRHS